MNLTDLCLTHHNRWHRGQLPRRPDEIEGAQPLQAGQKTLHLLTLHRPGTDRGQIMALQVNVESDFTASQSAKS